jgi:hypothetical protein
VSGGIGLFTGAFYVGNGWVAGGCWDLQKSNESPLRGRHPKITFRPGDDDKQNNYALKNEV